MGSSYGVDIRAQVRDELSVVQYREIYESIHNSLRQELLVLNSTNSTLSKERLEICRGTRNQIQAQQEDNVESSTPFSSPSKGLERVSSPDIDGASSLSGKQAVAICPKKGVMAGTCIAAKNVDWKIGDIFGAKRTKHRWLGCCFQYYMFFGALH